MKSIVFYIVLFAFILAGGLHAYDPPELYWYKQGDRDHVKWFYSYTWIGDQNGDGCDELLVGHEPYTQAIGRERDTFTNRVDLHYGGEEMSDEPDFTFNSHHERGTIGQEVSYLGNLTGNGELDFAIKRSHYERERGDDRFNWYIDIYQGGEDLDTIPEFTISLRGIRFDLIKNDRPCDINGDGYNDLLVRSVDMDENTALRIYYGGADFDTIPDDVVTNDDRSSFGVNGVTSGFDLNGDGMDELIIVSGGRGPADLYLGGEPVDSVVFTVYPDSYEGYHLSRKNMIADVNGDGYDDFGFGLSYGDPGWEEEEWLFFGSDSIDIEIDRVLEPGVVPYGSGIMHGGDVNGDGRNDVVLKSGSTGSGDIRIYFGSPWMGNEYAIEMNASPFEMGYIRPMTSTQGAYADFNGDGAGDFIVYSKQPDEQGPGRLAIFAGNLDWEMSSPIDIALPITHELTVSAHPNPFNSRVRLQIDAPVAGQLDLKIFDLNGKVVESNTRPIPLAGGYVYDWNASAFATGIYFVRVSMVADGVGMTAVRKLVYMK